MTDVEWTLRSLEAFPETLADFLAEIPSAARDWRPASWDGIPSEMLTIREQIYHLRDIEADGYLIRFSRVLRETEPALESIDTYALAAARDYEGTDLHQALASFADARIRTMGILRSARRSDFARQGAFEGYGKVTLLSLIHYLCSHDQQHLAGIQWLLGRYAAAL